MAAYSSQIPQIPQYPYHANHMGINHTGYGARDFQQYLQRPSARTIQNQQREAAHKEDLDAKYQRNMQKLHDAKHTMEQLTNRLSIFTKKEREKEEELLSCVARLRKVSKQRKRMQQANARVVMSQNTQK